MPVSAQALGPGKITVGKTGSLKDFSCQVTEATVTWGKDEDNVNVLCGDTLGNTVYSATFEGSIVQDWHDQNGILAWTWKNKGEVLPFVFVPSIAGKAQVKGNIIVDPIDLGGESMKKNTSDIKWTFAGEPSLSYDYTR